MYWCWYRVKWIIHHRHELRLVVDNIDDLNSSNSTWFVKSRISWLKSSEVICLAVLVVAFRHIAGFSCHRKHLPIYSETVFVVDTHFPWVIIFQGVLFTFFIKAFLDDRIWFVDYFILISGNHFISSGVNFFIYYVENFFNVFIFHRLRNHRWLFWIKILSFKCCIFIDYFDILFLFFFFICNLQETI